MAKNNEKNDKPTISSKSKKLLDKLSNQVNDMDINTYYSQNSEDLKTQVNDRLSDAIRRSTQDDDEFQNISNTSRLFRKLIKDDSLNMKTKNGKDSSGDISSLFKTPDVMTSIMDTYSKTRFITELDAEFDLICKYMTKLQSALDIKKDAVLCSDSYTKKFLNVRAKSENPSSDSNTTIQNNIDEMIRKYSLEDKAEQWYDDTSKYGEEFVYCVPYKQALGELLKRKKDTRYSISESESIINLNDTKNKASGSATVTEDGSIKVTLDCDQSKVFMEAIEHNLFLRKASGDANLRGLSETFVLNEANDTFNSRLKKNGKKTSVKFDKMIDNELEWDDDYDRTAASGLINSNKNNENIKVNGAVIKTVKHDTVIPIYIEDILFGAYSIRFSVKKDLRSTDNLANSMDSIFSNNKPQQTEEDHGAHDLLLRKIAGEISKNIDTAFINANADLKKEIYLMLKYNDSYNQIENNLNANVVFIPADDIHHLKFKEDPDTHRGVSDLWDSLVPAKQWITLVLTNVIGTATRSFDHRAYYVKQSVDTNVAQSLLNVISTIKKGNFGIRQMESINNILNVVGKFNDYIIPVGPSGDAPIQFDTLQGQQFNIDETFLQNLEEAAINPTGVPTEIVNSSTGMDFAVRYTMTNAKLLRNVLKRQFKMEDFLSTIFTKIYRFEYEEPVELEVTLPPPAFLSMTQGSQLLSSAMQYADSITEVEMAGQPDNAKNLFKKRIIRKLIPSYINDDDIREIKDAITIDASIEQNSEDNGQGNEY